jgi:hypothetical protein
MPNSRFKSPLATVLRRSSSFLSVVRQRLMASRGTGGRGSRRAEATARSACARGPGCMPPAGAFEVALFIWEPWKRTENLCVLRPKGSRFDSPGQRPGTRPNDVPKPQRGATLANDHLNPGHPRLRPVGPFFLRGTQTQAFSLGYRIATLWAATHAQSERPYI